MRGASTIPIVKRSNNARTDKKNVKPVTASIAVIIHLADVNPRMAITATSENAR
jgi:hypothetical protein